MVLLPSSLGKAYLPAISIFLSLFVLLSCVTLQLSLYYFLLWESLSWAVFRGNPLCAGYGFILTECFVFPVLGTQCAHFGQISRVRLLTWCPSYVNADFTPMCSAGVRFRFLMSGYFSPDLLREGKLPITFPHTRQVKGSASCLGTHTLGSEFTPHRPSSPCVRSHTWNQFSGFSFHSPFWPGVSCSFLGFELTDVLTKKHFFDHIQHVYVLKVKKMFSFFIPASVLSTLLTPKTWSTGSLSMSSLTRFASLNIRCKNPDTNVSFFLIVSSTFSLLHFAHITPAGGPFLVCVFWWGEWFSFQSMW